MPDAAGAVAAATETRMDGEADAERGLAISTLSYCQREKLSQFATLTLMPVADTDAEPDTELLPDTEHVADTDADPDTLMPC